MQGLAGIGQADDWPSSRQAWGGQPPSHEHDAHVLTPIQQLQPAGQGTWLHDSRPTGESDGSLLLLDSFSASCPVCSLTVLGMQEGAQTESLVATSWCPLDEPDLEGSQGCCSVPDRLHALLDPAVALQVLDGPAVKSKRRALQSTVWAEGCRHIPVRSLPECASSLGDMCAAQPEPLELDRDGACRGKTQLAASPTFDAVLLS